MRNDEPNRPEEAQRGGAPPPAHRPRTSRRALVVGLLLAAGTLVGLRWLQERRAGQRALWDDDAGVVAFLTAHHLRGLEGADADELEPVSVAEAEERLAADFPDGPRLDFLDGESLVLEGLGTCAVPAGGLSRHLGITWREGGEPAARVSLFLQRAPSALPLEEERALELGRRRTGAPTVLAWRRGEVLLFAVSRTRWLPRALLRELDGPPLFEPTCLGGL